MTRSLSVDKPTGGEAGAGIHVTGTVDKGTFDKPVRVIVLVPDHFGQAELHEFGVVPPDDAKSDWDCFFHPSVPNTFLPDGSLAHWYGVLSARGDDDPPQTKVKADAHYHHQWQTPFSQIIAAQTVGLSISIDGADKVMDPVDFGIPFTVKGQCTATTAGREGVNCVEIIASLSWLDDKTGAKMSPDVEVLNLPPLPAATIIIPDPKHPEIGTWHLEYTLRSQPVQKPPLNALFCAAIRTYDPDTGVAFDGTRRSTAAALRIPFQPPKPVKPRRHK
jgi:hypothetical protein